jgi:hypothetical protein
MAVQSREDVGVMNFVRRLVASLASALTLSPAQAQQTEMVSWVVLSNSPLELTAESLRGTLEQLYPGKFRQGEQTNFVIDGAVPGAQFLIQSNVPGAAGLFMLQNVAGPYNEFSDFARGIADAQMRAEAWSQQAWLAVDNIKIYKSREDAYRFIGRVLAELAPPDAAFLVHPSLPITIRFDEDVRRRLASGEQIP